MPFFLLAESWSRYGTGVVTGGLLDKMLYRYTTLSGGAELSTSFGRNGVGIRISNGNLTKTAPHSDTWVVGFAVKFPESTDNNNTIYDIRNNDHVLFQLIHNTDQTLTIAAGPGTTYIGTTNRALQNGRWYWIDMTITFSGSITCTAELRINGHVEASGSGTTGFTTSQMLSQDATGNKHVLWGLTNFQSVYYDDFYMKNATGYYGDIRIIALFPNGDAGLSDWTPQTAGGHYLMVNTHPADITKYVQTATPGNIDTYEWEDIPTFSGTVCAVNMGFLANKDDEGTKSFKIVFGNVGTEELSAEFFVSTDTPEYYEHSNENDPHTSAPWTQAGWNATKAGVKLIS